MEGAANLFVAGFLAAITVMSWTKITLDADKLKDFPELQAMQCMVNVIVGIAVRYL